MTNARRAIVSSKRRLWLFRLAAVALGLSIFLVIEVVCRLTGVGIPENHEDPFVGFSQLHPLFVLDESDGEYRIPVSKQKYFVEDSFPATKPTDSLRIFCLGGSTVQGRPFSIETSFARFLELAVQQALPDRQVDVVNCGGISYASYRLVPVLQECLNYEPDLIVLCTGHNEFLETRTYGHIRDELPLVSIPHQHLSRLHSYHLMRSVLLDSRTYQPESELSADVVARLDYRNGLSAYKRDDAWRASVIRHFEFNVNRMLHLARQANVPVVLILPPSNLADASPFAAAHRTDFSENDLQKVIALQEGLGNGVHAINETVAALEKMVACDDQMASYRFSLAEHYALQGRHEDARREYVAARDEDICPLRILTPMEEALRTAAEEWRVPFLDAHRLLESKTDDGILDNAWMLDHVHPSIQGHRVIAVPLAHHVVHTLSVSPRDGWHDELDSVFDEHEQNLPPTYYFQGERRLENLRAWTRGEADGPEYQGQ